MLFKSYYYYVLSTVSSFLSSIFNMKPSVLKQSVLLLSFSHLIALAIDFRGLSQFSVILHCLFIFQKGPLRRLVAGSLCMGPGGGGGASPRLLATFSWLARRPDFSLGFLNVFIHRYCVNYLQITQT